jgi:formylglycine-generating enzyme required for sulfatase activity
MTARRLSITLILTALWPPLAQASVPPDFTRLPAATIAQGIAPSSIAAQRDMLAVPAGDYPIGRSNGPRDQRPQRSVRLDAFRVDRTEVTNAAFAEYLNALALEMRGSFAIAGISDRNGSKSAMRLLTEGADGSGRYPIIALDDDQVRIILADGRFMPAPGYEDHPVAETTWAGARGYCRWRGADLPTEAQWEAAARGESDRLYPWGDQPPSARRAFVSGRSGVTASVGARPEGASPFGVLDMSGSMAEWTSSLKRPYPYDAADGREAQNASGERVTRGGDYRYDRSPETLSVSHRNGFSNAPERGHRHIGFRCASR